VRNRPAMATMPREPRHNSTDDQHHRAGKSGNRVCSTTDPVIGQSIDQWADFAKSEYLDAMPDNVACYQFEGWEQEWKL